MSKGNFTLPGEAGYEKLTLKMAEKWGADIIRDSDGTQLSDEILESGYGIYSTICIIRGHNEWAKKHPQNLQQTFLMSQPVIAEKEGIPISIHLLDGYYADQFRVNETAESMAYWQVFDRTINKEVETMDWKYDPNSKCVVINNVLLWHSYTVNFLAWRIWEEISMYNHTTNNWGDKEHLMPIDPRSKETQEYLLGWMDKWCEEHPQTTVVRFTSLFYNYVWIWGDDQRRRNLFTDWGSYDFTVSVLALKQFEQEYDYALTSEDFINQGKRHPNNLPPNQKLRDYIDFTNRFVVSFASKLIDIVHRHGKKAYMFYDDSWVGSEPYSGRFSEMKFDGIIKCVFNGYEVRQCADVDVPVHEIRLHPYLFPVGLNGKPTFMKGGKPEDDAREFWCSVRRALLRKTVDRIGLGGYLHLTENFPAFQDAIAEIADEFRTIRECHQNGDPYSLPIHVGILTSWGKLRTWSLSGNFSETSMHDLLHVIEALSGMPVEVSFIDFEEIIKDGFLDDYDVLINAGRAGLSWTGGDAWNNTEVITSIKKWTAAGGTFLGVNEPSAVEGYFSFFRMSEVLGVDEDSGAGYSCQRWPLEQNDGISIPKELVPEGTKLEGKEDIVLLKGDVSVLLKDVYPAQKSLMGKDLERPILCINCFGRGKGIYLSQFKCSGPNNRLLLNLLLYAKGLPIDSDYLTDNPETECAYYSENKKLAIVNNSKFKQDTKVKTPWGRINVSLKPQEMKYITTPKNA